MKQWSGNQIIVAIKEGAWSLQTSRLTNFVIGKWNLNPKLDFINIKHFIIRLNKQKIFTNSYNHINPADLVFCLLIWHFLSQISNYYEHYKTFIDRICVKSNGDFATALLAHSQHTTHFDPNGALFWKLSNFVFSRIQNVPWSGRPN